MKIIDFHNHYYPPEYIESLRRGSSKITVTFDDDGNPVLHSPGDINVIVPGHRDIDFRQNVLDAARSQGCHPRLEWLPGLSR